MIAVQSHPPDHGECKQASTRMGKMIEHIWIRKTSLET